MSDHDEDVVNPFRTGKTADAENLGLNLGAMSLSEILYMAARTGPIMMMPSEPGDFSPLGFIGIIAGIPEDVCHALQEAFMRVLLDHDIVDPESAQMLVSREEPRAD